MLSFEDWLDGYRLKGEPKLLALARASAECDVAVNTLRKVLRGNAVSERVALKVERLTSGQVEVLS